MENLLKIKFVFPLILFLSIGGFFAHTHFTKTAIFADGKFYYSTTRSIIKDIDIDFENEYRQLDIEVNRTRTGYVWNMYPPGTSLLWMPAFILAESAINTINLVPEIKIDDQGYSLIYQTSVAVSSIILGLLGLFLVYLVLKKYFSEETSLIATIALFATTNLLFYISVEQINSHAASFFASSLFIYYFLLHKQNRYHYLILGIIGGIVGLVRTQDAAILILPAIQLLLFTEDTKHKILNSIHLASGFLIGFLPQIYFWHKIFDTIGSPYTNFGFSFLSPKIFHVLFNSKNGLLLITPSIAVAITGMFIALRSQTKVRKIVIYGIIYFLLQLYLISSWSFYDQGGSFSIRMMITTYPMLAFGYAEIMRRLKNNYPIQVVLSLILITAGVNALFIFRYLSLY